jgi:cell division protein FtsN
MGHTAKFCPVLGEKKQREDRRQKDDDRRVREEENRIREEKKKQMEPKKQNSRGGFSALIDSDDEQEATPKKQVKQEEWPLLGNPTTKVSYASMANKTQPIKKSEPVAEQLPSGFHVLQMGAKYEKTEAVAVKKQYDPKSWSRPDSDDEDEDEDW